MKGQAFTVSCAEPKNYTGRVKQAQILTTEKYLLEKGLRRVAIVVTRAGAHKDAIAMTQGAMRENGKLMLIVGNRSAPPLPQQSSAGHFQNNTGHLEGDEIRWGR